MPHAEDQGREDGQVLHLALADQSEAIYLKETCLQCHSQWDEKQARYVIESMAGHYQGKVRNAEFWLSQLIGKFGQAQLVGVGEDTLKAARAKHGDAHANWEWWTAANGASFHNPELAHESLAKSVSASQEGIKLLEDAIKARPAAATPSAALASEAPIVPHAMTSQRPAMVGLAVALAVALSTLALGLDAVRGHSHPPAGDDAGAPAFAAVASDGAPPIREQLALHLARNPRDGRGWMLLARIEFDRDRFHAAADAFGKAIDASPRVARDPGVWCEYADALAMAQGGILAGRPRELVERALALDARHARALEMAGSAAFEAGDFAAAARNWRQLLAQMPEDTQERRDLALAIRKAERRIIASDPIAGMTLRQQVGTDETRVANEAAAGGDAQHRSRNQPRMR